MVRSSTSPAEISIVLLFWSFLEFLCSGQQQPLDRKTYSKDLNCLLKYMFEVSAPCICFSSSSSSFDRWRVSLHGKYQDSSTAFSGGDPKRASIFYRPHLYIFQTSNCTCYFIFASQFLPNL